MLILALIISSSVSQLTFVSPDELKNFNAGYREAPFGDPGAYLTYGKLLPFEISTNCEIPDSISKNITSETILVLYLFKNDCDFGELADAAEYYNAKGVFFVWNKFDYPGNIASAIKVYPYRGSDTYKVKILCLFIDSAAGEAIQQYSTKSIWITYRMQIINETKDQINLYLNSDPLDFQYFIYLNQIFNEASLSEYKFNMYLLYTNTSSDPDTDCYKSINNKYYCLPSTNLAKGKDRVINTMLILNFYYSLNSNYLTLRNYTRDLNAICYNDFTIECNKKVIESYNVVHSFDESKLNYSYLLYEQFIPSASSHGNFIYNPQYFQTIFSISSHKKYYFENGCNSVKLENDRCEFDCNTTSVSYDNLKCLKDHGCYTFIMGDGNCNKGCEIDPDCDDENIDMVFIKIILPAIAVSVM